MSTVHTGEPKAIGASDRPLAAGDVVGEYVIDAVLGQGGFGTVYRATHPVIGKQVAIKVLARRYSADEAIVSRFVDEARAVNQIRHRNIIDIFSFGELTDGRHYYVMELLEGEPLDKYLERTGPLPVAEALPILKSIAKALDAAHGKGIAHRDLKPENIFLAHDGEGERFPKLLDFGIAKLLTRADDAKHRTATGAPIGTPYYMSPEQCRGKDVDHRTDIYSFGILAYRLLTGAYPFEGETYMDLMVAQMNETAPPPSSKHAALSPAIDAAIAHMMQKDPAARPPSVSAAVAAMGAASSITPGQLAMAATMVSGTAPAVTAAAPPRSRAPLWIALGVVLVGGGGIVAWQMTKREDRAPAPVVATPAPKPAPAPKPTPKPEPVPEPPKLPARVIFTIEGAPEGTSVLARGKMIGAVPSIELDRGDQPVVLTFVADGYLPGSVTVVPDHAQTRKVTLKKRARPAAKQQEPGRDDIIPNGQIPGLKQ